MISPPCDPSTIAQSWAGTPATLRNVHLASGERAAPAADGEYTNRSGRLLDSPVSHAPPQRVHLAAGRRARSQRSRPSRTSRGRRSGRAARRPRGRAARGLRKDATRLRVVAQAGERLAGTLAHGHSSRRVVTLDVGERRQELVARLWREADLAGHALASSSSAAARTSSRSWPTPASISTSPAASRRKISSSCCVR